MDKIAEMTQERVKELLEYDPETGVFTWKAAKKGIYAGSKAGYSNQEGYAVITIKRKPYYAHRLAFLYMEGRFPNKEVDHINRDAGDNRWVNLRHSNRRENLENKITNNDFIGVYWHKGERRWKAVTSRAGRKRHALGSFKTHIAACYARWIWEISEQESLA